MAPSPHTPTLHHDALPETWRCLRSWQPKTAPTYAGRPCRGTGTPLLLVVPISKVSVSPVCLLPPFCSSRESLRKERNRQNIAKGRPLTAITQGISGKTLDSFLPLNPTKSLKERLGQRATLLLVFGRKRFPDLTGLYAIRKLLPTVHYAKGFVHLCRLTAASACSFPTCPPLPPEVLQEHPAVTPLRGQQQSTASPPRKHVQRHLLITHIRAPSQLMQATGKTAQEHIFLTGFHYFPAVLGTATSTLWHNRKRI